MKRVPLTLLFLGLTGCVFLLPGRFWRLVNDPNTKILLISDSQAVRRLIADEDAREVEIRKFFRESHSREERTEHLKDMIRNPEKYPPGREEFLVAMAHMPGIYVGGKPYCDIVERSGSTCGHSPVETATFVFVKITTGRSRGQQGWICESVVQQQFP